VPDTEDAYKVILGRNISADRGRLQLSQTAVAARMQELGFEDWRQQTVAGVEKGRRRVTAEEVLGLVLALESTLPRLLAPIGGDLWVELPSDSGHLLPGADVIGLANGAKGGAGTTSWYKNSLVRAVVSPREVEGEGQPVVAAIVTSPLGVLVGRRNDGTPPWTFIAGEQDAVKDENPADTAVREVKEETGLRVRVGDVIGERVHPKTHRRMIYMAAVPTHGMDVFVGDEDELAEVRWVSLAEADELLPGMFEPVREHLAEVLGEAGES
jgi:8-oxo-dGTP pyrophosphatase MutT (NUDIX family)